MDVNRFELRDVEHKNYPGMQFTMPLVSVHGDKIRCIGTGFLVGPGLAITAAHVVAEWIERQEQRDGYNQESASVSVVAYQLFQGKLLPWTVISVHVHWTADLAFLAFARPAWWGDGLDQSKPPYANIYGNADAPSALLHLRRHFDETRSHRHRVVTAATVSSNADG